MKRFGIVFFTICTILFFFGCADSNPIAPEQNQSDQTTASFEKGRCRTTFTGTSNFVQPIDPGTTTTLPNGKTLLKGQIAEWYDDATDARVTGQSIWVVNKLLNEDGTGRAWGTAEINVDGSLGKWKLVWWGKITEVGVDAKAVGFGTQGDVRGLSAKWTYTMVFANGIFYTTEGKIIQRCWF